MTVEAAAVSAEARPFPHAVSSALLAPALAEEVLVWLESDAPWKLRVESFYEQYELNLAAATLPNNLASLVTSATIAELSKTMLTPIEAGPLELLEVNAHKLVRGQTIRIHNDYLGGVETYRLLVQLNRGWRDDDGGVLMLFSGPNAADVSRLLRPLHGCAVAFAISPRSYHAVSTIRSGERYTLVYSYRRIH